MFCVLNLTCVPHLQVHIDGVGVGQRQCGDAEAVLGPRHRPGGGCERQRPPLRDGGEGDLVRRERAGRHSGHQAGAIASFIWVQVVFGSKEPTF